MGRRGRGLCLGGRLLRVVWKDCARSAWGAEEDVTLLPQPSANGALAYEEGRQPCNALGAGFNYNAAPLRPLYFRPNPTRSQA